MPNDHQVRSKSSLPAEKLRPVTPLQAGRLIVALLAGVLLINYLAGLYLANFPLNRTIWLHTVKWQLLATTESPLEWMFLGDSSCNQGVDTTMVAAQLGGQARNLCTTGQMILIDDVLMLEEHIAEVGVPQTVVIVHTWDLWSRSLVTEALGTVPLEWGYWEERDLVALDWATEWEIFLIRNLPVVAQNSSLGRAIRDELPAGRLWEKRFQLDNTGYMHLPDERAHEERSLNDAERLLPTLVGQGFLISPTNEQLLERLRTLAETYEFDLIFINGPLVAEMANDERLEGFQTAHDDYFNALAASSEQIEYVPGFSPIPAEYTIGIDHTTHSGALIFTQQLIDALDSLLNTP